MQVRLKGKALEIYRSFSEERDRLAAEMLSLAEREEEARREMFLAVSGELGIDPAARDMVLDDSMADFGVVLLMDAPAGQLQAADEMEDESDGEEATAPAGLFVAAGGMLN